MRPGKIFAARDGQIKRANCQFDLELVSSAFQFRQMLDLSHIRYFFQADYLHHLRMYYNLLHLASKLH